MQVLIGVHGARRRPDESSGVAVWAHIGGFIAGMLLVKVFENPRLVAQRNAIREQPCSCGASRGSLASARLLPAESARVSSTRRYDGDHACA